MSIAFSDLILLYGAVLGFAMAGVVACSFEYVTRRPLRFDIDHDVSALGGLCGVLVRLIAGPYLVARFLNAGPGHEAPLILVAISSLLVVAWSLSLGVLIISSFLG